MRNYIERNKWGWSMKRRWFNRALFVDNLWYGRQAWHWCLVPFSLVYALVAALRRFYLKRWCETRFPVPIVVVGNITVGGVGKTPLVIALAKQCQQRGLRVGIVSRGYGASIGHFPHEVHVEDTAALVGDEPLLLARKTGCPVVIAPKRVDAVRYLLKKYPLQLIISDDGLQHYAMGRAIEMVVMDGTRGLGNGWSLPAGPLREPASRLREVDFVVVNGGDRAGAYRMDMLPGSMTNLRRGDVLSMAEGSFPVAAVAAIGNPSRFFALLQALNVPFNPYPFEDHHPFKAEEFRLKEKIVVMTEKDAVKCESFATDAMYVLSVEATMSDAFWEAFWSHGALRDYS